MTGKSKGGTTGLTPMQLPFVERLWNHTHSKVEHPRSPKVASPVYQHMILCTTRCIIQTQIASKVLVSCQTPLLHYRANSQRYQKSSPSGVTDRLLGMVHSFILMKSTLYILTSSLIALGVSTLL